MCLGVFPSHPGHAIVQLCTAEAALKAKWPEKKRGKITSILLHSWDHRACFPSSSGQRDGLFPGLVGSRDAQQQISVLMRSNLRSGQGGKKTKRYREYPIPLFVFCKETLYPSCLPRKEFFLEFLLSSPTVHFLDWTHIWVKAKR